MGMRDLIPWRRRGRNRTLLPLGGEHPFAALHRELDRLFEDFFVGRDWWPPAPLGGRVFSPSVDVRESDKEVRVSAELPGLDEKDLEVELSDEGLTIRGEKKHEQEDRGEGYYKAERSYGAFEWFIDLPCAVDGEKAAAEFKNGVLTVALPKLAEEAGSRKKIEIKRG